MNRQQIQRASSAAILRAMTIYLAACGLSAVFLPSLWQEAAGVDIPNIEIALGVVGVLLCALALLSWQASRETAYLPVAVAVLLAAHIGDAGVVAFYTASGTLPLNNGSLLLLVDLLWIGLLLRLKK